MTGRAASSMGKDKIRYLIFLKGRWRWRPTKRMREAGFQMINLSGGTMVDGRPAPSMVDKARAVRLNEDWDRTRRGLPSAAVEERRYPPGSVGEGYLRAMRLREAGRRAKSVEWTKEQHSRDDWPRAWRWIEPLFGDCDPKTVTPEQFIGDPNRPDVKGLREIVATRVSDSEAHRVIKVWRALWKKMAVFGYCELDRDPSLMFANSAPQPRSALWREGEAVRLVKQAWRDGYKGLAALLAAAWDTQLSPVDVRRLGARDLKRDRVGLWFDLARAKTGQGAIGTLSPRGAFVVLAYLDEQAAEAVGAAPIFRNRSGASYSKDTLGDDFRAIRVKLFGPGDYRQLADFRRSGAVEAVSGDVAPAKLSSKMANTISTSNKLHKTYSPAQLAQVRDADAARRRGRAVLREQKPAESVTTPARKVSPSDGG